MDGTLVCFGSNTDGQCDVPGAMQKEDVRPKVAELHIDLWQTWVLGPLKGGLGFGDLRNGGQNSTRV